MRNFDVRGIGPLLIYGDYSAFKAEAEKFISALGELRKAGLVFVGADEVLETQQLANWSMFLMLGWQARDHETRILENVRKAHADIPIVVHSLIKDPVVRMKAFTNGADNFVSPDCEPAEITAKLRRLLRFARNHRMSPASVQVRDLTIWPKEKVVLRNGRRIQLSQRELDTLIYLAKEHPKSVSRRTLEREVFGFRADPGTNVVAVHVHRLRKKIEADKDTLRTVPGGYQLT